MKRIMILGNTGSIGRQALSVIAAHEQQFSVCAVGLIRIGKKRQCRYDNIIYGLPV